MISDKMQAALNDQINAEFYASYLYLSMSAHFQTLNLNGFSTWMRVQAQEELGHAIKFYDFIIERDGTVELQQVEAPPVEWDNPLTMFEGALQHEQGVTARIYNLVDLSLGERDHATNAFLQWFVTEQVEEEATATDVVNQLKRVGDSPDGLFLLDREMGQRTAGAAAPAAE